MTYTLASLLFGLILNPCSATSSDTPAKDGMTADYVIVGGGTCGLVLANRLSEDPSVSVIVLEAGASAFNNTNVTRIDTYGAGLNTEVDWQYSSTPQIFADNATREYNAGKAIGGTTVINGRTYVRATIQQIDSWESVFGNEGWNWENLFPYYLKSEQFQVPDAAQQAKGATYDAPAHGIKGPVDVGWMYGMGDANAYQRSRDAWTSAGIGVNQDPNTGVLDGFSVWPSTVNRALDIRWDAGRAYYYPVQHRPNLKLLQNASVIDILWSESRHSPHELRADGVRVQVSHTSKPITVRAHREVILSAGSLRSPGLLEASGVGNPSVLAAASIPLKLSLPSVGQNLQDQPNTNIISLAGPAQNFTGYPTYVTFATIRDLFPTNYSAVEAQVRHAIPSYARSIVAAAAPNSTTQAIQEHLLSAQADLIFTQLIPCAEILTAPFNTIIANPIWNLVPFSRGSVHINATSPSRPLINPNFFMIPWDASLQAAAARLTRQALAAGRQQASFGDEQTPGLATVPADASDADWASWFKTAYFPNNHPVGSAAMMSRELGGVVDSRLKVYGIANVRVVDASVLPAQVDGHLSSTLYALAERAADLVKEDWKCR